MRMPAALASAQGAFNTKYLCLYFRRGTIFVGTCKLPIVDMIQALMSQVQHETVVACFPHGLCVKSMYGS